MTVQLHPVRGISIRTRIPARLVHRQPASPARILSTAFTLGSTVVVLAVLFSRPSAVTAVALGAVVLGHALLSFAWEEPGPSRASKGVRNRVRAR
jgi:protein-S-isoprenylcysteine O-methyltransferase Ste14